MNVLDPDAPIGGAGIGGPDISAMLCAASPACAAKQAGEDFAVSEVGQATQEAFSAVMGPIAEVALTVVLAGAGLAMVTWAVIHLAKGSATVQNTTAKVNTAAGAAAAPVTGGASIGAAQAKNSAKAAKK